MNHIKFIPILLLIVSCSNELRVYTDQDRDVELPRLTNYDWLPQQQIELGNNPIYYNELTDKRIKAAVERQLTEKGYKRSEKVAEFIIHYHIIIENKMSVRTEPFGYNYGTYWIRNELDSYRYDEGTLIIDIMDVRNCELIWRGWAVSILDDDKLITEDLINRAVPAIFKTFPVSAAKEVTIP